MSRKSDIELAWNVYYSDWEKPITAAIEAAYDLGRAAQAEKDSMLPGRMALAKRLRAKVRKAGETR